MHFQSGLRDSSTLIHISLGSLISKIFTLPGFVSFDHLLRLMIPRRLPRAISGEPPCAGHTDSRSNANPRSWMRNVDFNISRERGFLSILKGTPPARYAHARKNITWEGCRKRRPTIWLYSATLAQRKNTATTSKREGAERRGPRFGATRNLIIPRATCANIYCYSTCSCFM